MAKTFGSVVKSARLFKRMTLEGLARKIGIHKGYLSGIENDKVRPPSASIVKALCATLGLNCETMLVTAWWQKRSKGIGLRAAIDYLLNLASEEAKS